MEELAAKVKYVDEPRQAKSAYTVEELLKAIPASMRRYAKRVAPEDGVRKEDCKLRYRNAKTLDVNLTAITTAISRIPDVLGPTKAELASARGELENQRQKALKALNKSNTSAKNALSQLQETTSEYLSDMLEWSSDGYLTENYYAEEGSEPIVQPIEPTKPATPAKSVPATPITPANDTKIKPAVPITPANSTAGLRSTNLMMPSAQPTGDWAQRRAETSQQLVDPASNQYFRPSGLAGSDTFQIQSLEAGVAPAFDANQNLAGAPPYMPQYSGSYDNGERLATAISKGVVENDFRSYPNFRTLGIDRAAGPATNEELKSFSGQTKPDGSPVTGSDFFSVGAVLGNIDIIPHLMAFIPPVELARIGEILMVRAKKSDQDHSRQVMSGNFTIINPKMGRDPEAKMHMDHPLLGQVPYTALVARLVFPIMENDPGQAAAVEAARRGKIQNLSMAFGFGGIACGLCGEMQINEVIKSNGNIIGFTIDPSSNSEMCQDHGTEDEYYYPMSGTIRLPVNMEGGFMYKTVTVLKAGEDGTIQIDPLPESILPLDAKSVFMMSMRGFWGYSFCRLHGFLGQDMKDGRKTVGMFTQIRALINVSAVDCGAIGDAMCVLDPDAARPNTSRAAKLIASEEPIAEEPIDEQLGYYEQFEDNEIAQTEDIRPKQRQDQTAVVLESLACAVERLNTKLEQPTRSERAERRLLFERDERGQIIAAVSSEGD